MRLSLRLLLVTSALAWPMAAFGAAPVVNGVRATLENNQVHVSWQAPQTERPIVSYRIYESKVSILQNNGEYGDFETVTGTQTGFILTNIPDTHSLCVSVMAVNDLGEESPFFAEEASVTIPVNTVEASEQSVAASEPLKLLQAEALSATGVVLSFSDVPVIEESQAASAFQITDGSGAVLAITHITIQDAQIFLTTETQEAGKTYVVQASSAVSGRSPSGQLIPLDDGAAQALFIGTGFATSALQPTPVIGNNSVTSAGPSPAITVDIPPQPSVLNQSGPGALIALAASGGVMGWRKLRKHRNQLPK